VADHKETLKGGYEAYNSGDIEGVLATWSDDVKWEGGNSDLPAGGDYQGKDQVVGAFGELGEAWESLSVTPDEMVAEGDSVVVLGHLEGTPKGGGDSVKSPFAHVYRFDGDKVSRIQVLTDTLAGARALGKV
jgi:ketosteroid isomerase-like protein